MAFYSAGVEYGIHCLLFLVDELGDSREASVRDLADLQGVPHDYLAKIFTKLAKAKLVVATEGIRGGFKLAKPSDEISVLDIALAIDGQKSAFECREIRGRCVLFDGSPPEWALDGMCAVHATMVTAQKRMEDALSQQTILDLARRLGRKAPVEFSAGINDWMANRRESKASASTVQAAGTATVPLVDITEGSK
ncbi:Rrf2 family transcriptional regulator [Pseudomonas sp.]|uniref:RrF2 family transcriptional regulator n=1 Tax=Pseudomonas sp. TaxID=306 RepID=UPI0026178355|nr:Rrf2 family transcriptional regulator [Pseudomonas sp.]